MSDFKNLFQRNGTKEHPYPRSVEYRGKAIFLWDKFLIQNKDTLIFSVEETNSDYPQGFCIGVYDGYIKVNGKASSSRRKYTNNLFWEDSEILDSKHIIIQVFTKKEYVIIKNVWEIDMPEKSLYIVPENSWKTMKQKGVKEACFVGSNEWNRGNGNGSAMYSEDMPNGKRYFCNDGDEDDDFDDIIFTIVRKV